MPLPALTIAHRLTDDDQQHVRLLRIGPLTYWSFRLKGPSAPAPARCVGLGRWNLMRGPGDGLTEGLSSEARLWWLRSAFPQILLARETKEASRA